MIYAPPPPSEFCVFLHGGTPDAEWCTLVSLLGLMEIASQLEDNRCLYFRLYDDEYRVRKLNADFFWLEADKPAYHQLGGNPHSTRTVNTELPWTKGFYGKTIEERATRLHSMLVEVYGQGVPEYLSKPLKARDELDGVVTRLLGESFNAQIKERLEMEARQSISIGYDVQGREVHLSRGIVGMGSVLESCEDPPTALSAQADNYDPTNFGTCDYVRQDLTGNQTITGFAAPAGTDNHRFCEDPPAKPTIRVDCSACEGTGKKVLFHVPNDCEVCGGSGLLDRETAVKRSFEKVHTAMFGDE